MKINQYLQRYEALQESIRNDEKMLELIRTGQCSFVLSRLGEAGWFAPDSKHAIGQVGIDEAALERRLARKNRLYEKTTLRIRSAVERISSPTYRDFVIYRYLYGFKPDKLAQIHYYSERHIYRKAQCAKRQLYLALLQVMPRRAPRTGPRRYRILRGRTCVKRYIRPGLIPRPPRPVRQAG